MNMVPFLWAPSFLWAPWAPLGPFPLGPMGPGRFRVDPGGFWWMTVPYVGGRNKPIGETLNTPPQNPEADKFKKPYIKVVRDSCLWDSGRWDGWELILGLIPPFFRDI